MAPPACESASQAVEESDARGSKKGGPGGQIRPPRGPISRSGASGDLLGRLGRQVGLRRALWARTEQLENCMEGSWDRLGALLARLGPVLGRFSSPGGGAGRVILKVFWGLPGREAKTEHFSNI